MNMATFETSVKNFFSKAGVELLKRNEDFRGDDNAPSFVLLDKKRNTYYVTEFDVPDDTDLEINAALSDMDTTNIDIDVARTMLKVGRALDDKYAVISIDDVDVSSLTKKSAIIVTKDNADSATLFFSTNDITTQQVAINKGEFVAHLIEVAQSKKLAKVYNDIAVKSDVETLDATDDVDIVDNIAEEPIQETPQKTDANEVDDGDFDFEKGFSNAVNANFVNDIEISQEDLDNAIQNAANNEATPETNSADETEISQEDLDKALEAAMNKEIVNDVASSVDTTDDFVSPYSNNEPLTTTKLSEADVRKLEELNIDDMLPANSNLIKSLIHEDDNLYSGILNEEEKNKASEVLSPTNQFNFSSADDALEANPTPKWVEGETATVAPVVHTAQKVTPEKKKKKAPKQKKTSSKSNSADIILSIMSLLVATPHYLIKVATNRILPLFVIYWAAAVAVIFGFYKVWTVPVAMYATKLNAMTDELVKNMVANIPLISFTDMAMADTVYNALSTSVVLFASYKSLYSMYSVDFLLLYIPSVGAILAIFPFARVLGLRVMATSAISYAVLPYLFMLFGSMGYKTIMAIKSPVVDFNSSIASVSNAFMSLAILPLVSIIGIYIITGWILRALTHEKGVAT